MSTNTKTRRAATTYREILAGERTVVVPATFAGAGKLVHHALVGRVTSVVNYDDGGIAIHVTGKGIDGGYDAKSYVCKDQATAEWFVSTLTVI